MTTLADELVRFAERHSAGTPLRSACHHLVIGWPDAKRAAIEANASLRLWLTRSRTSRTLMIAPLGTMRDEHRVCIGCGKIFDAPKAKKNGRLQLTKRRTCSHACRNRWSWRKPETKARRSAGIKVAHSTTEAKARLAAHNERRWSKPGERERMSEQNRRIWADPVAGPVRASAIRYRHRQPDQRKDRSERMKARWDDPAGRKKMLDGIRKSKQTPEARAKFSALLAERWKDPAWRKKWLRSCRINGAKGGRRKKLTINVSRETLRLA